MKKQGSYYSRAISINGEKLKRILKEKNITQKQLADAVGVHINTINNCIRLGRIERFEKVVDICNYLGLYLDDISDDEQAIDYYELQESRYILAIALKLIDHGFDLDKNSTRVFLETIKEIKNEQISLDELNDEHEIILH